MSTIFSKIIDGDIPGHIVYDDAETVAFLDAKPINPGHTLVVPRGEYENIFEIPEDTFLAVMKTVHKLSPIIKEAVGADGINIGNNNGSAAGQEVFHYHVHIMPRFQGDGYDHWSGDENYHDEEHAENISKKIKTLLSD